MKYTEKQNKSIIQLIQFKKRIDVELEKFLKEKLDEALRVSPEVVPLAEQIYMIVKNGGKRLRPAFMYFAYKGVGGRDEKAILYTSMAVELLHTFALVHDDIIDKSLTRRGLATPHMFFKEMHEKQKWLGDSYHFGISSAILSGDLAHIYADQILTNSPFPREDLEKAHQYYDISRIEVVFGQHLDILGGVKRNFTEKEILHMLEYKSGKYSIERPLHCGAALARAPKIFYRAFSDYGITLGQAFQIQDDILGMFGDEEKTGKSTDSDIKEGKRTLLVIKAYENANIKQKKILDKALGNPKVSAKEVESVRQIVKETGSYQYSKDLARKLIEKAKKGLKIAPLTEESYDYLTGIADYMLEREC